MPTTIEGKIEEIENYQGGAYFSIHMHDMIVNIELEQRLAKALRFASDAAKQNQIILSSIYFDYTDFDWQHGSTMLFSTLEEIDNLKSLTLKSSGISIEALSSYLRNTTTLTTFSIRNSDVQGVFTHHNEHGINITNHLLSALHENNSIEHLDFSGFNGITFDNAWLELLQSNPILSFRFDADPSNPTHTLLQAQSNNNHEMQVLRYSNPKRFRVKCREQKLQLDQLGIQADKRLLSVVKPASLKVLAAEELINHVSISEPAENDLYLLPFEILVPMLLLNISPRSKFYNLDYFENNPKKEIVKSICKKYNLPVQDMGLEAEDEEDDNASPTCFTKMAKLISNNRTSLFFAAVVVVDLGIADYVSEKLFDLCEI